MKLNKVNNISILKNCFGCGVCSSACPHDIIKIIENKKGFYSPLIIDNNKCVNCGICLSVCSFYSDIKCNNSNYESYASWSNNSEIRYNASSGGIAYELALSAIKNGYKFCGVKYNINSHRAEHYICSTEEELKLSLGSKYIPSYTEEAFKHINFNDKYIVFGTPCQIASLRLMIQKKKKEDNFILVDFFCHGVPSLKMWDKYISETGIKDNKEIVNIKWRDKKTGWHDSWRIVAVDKNNKEIYRSKNVNEDLFYKYFLGHYALSNCCIESCKFKQNNSMADIRIGDLWGDEYKNEEKGVSGLICYTENGGELISSLKNTSLIIHSNETVTQGQMKNNAKKPRGYKFVNFLLKIKPLKLSNILTIKEYIILSIDLPKIIINKLKRILL
ncbi:MAG: Coenzyme F420 hydrogenase/dehydrogenase, beta subunit C-terminal domain [Bacteroidales bacterium]|nr:Coenzyme F420 hydrogenase/dehydrogenase, beta subunit C-terminal domain [Bacteroidales bacterium]